MKKLLWICGIIGIIHAGWIIKFEEKEKNEKLETTNTYISKGIIVFETKENVFIFDFKKEIIRIIDHDEKSYAEGTIDEYISFIEGMHSRMMKKMEEIPPEQRKMIEEMMKMMQPKINIKKLDRSEKILGYNTEVYEVEVETGGDYSNTINISTIASFILSACGVCVAKHSSKKMTSTCGSADLLSKAGYNLNTPFEIVKKSIEEEGIGFLYAPLYHPMARRVAKIRAQLGVITTFNIIGALANPVNITHRLMGVNEKRILKPVSEAIREIGIKKGLVLISNDGLDEISIFDKTYGILIENEKLKEIEIYPEDFGIKREKNIESIKVKGKTNALKMMLDILECKIPIDSPPIKIVLANVSAALYVMNRVNDFKEGYEFAKETLLSKKALEKFKSWLKISNS